MSRHTLKRILEIIPGLLTWSALLLPILVSIWLPVVIAIYVIIFDLYWLYRSLYLSRNIIVAYFRIKKDTKINWMTKIRNYEESHKLWPRGVKFDETLHVIIMPQYNETYDVISRSLESYIKSNFPVKSKMIFVLTSEIRKPGLKELNQKTFDDLKKRYGQKFLQFEQTFHPPDISGELACKSSNSTWGAKFFKNEILDKKKIAYNKVVVHNFDTDTQVHPQYFAAIAYQYLMTPNDLPTSYQPIHLYNNNIWETGAIMRIVATSSTITLMHNSLRPHRFKNFSSRSDCFQTIVDINYWVVDAIPEDSRQFFDSMYHYKGRFWVQPIYVPLLMDAVLDDNWLKTLKTQYQQLRRWAWGIVDFPYTALKAFDDHEISWRKKLSWSLRLLEGHFSWATAAIHIAILGWMPILLNPKFGDTVIGFNLPTITRTVLNISIVGMITVIILSLIMLPPKPKHYRRRRYLMFILQWGIFPVVSLFFSSIASIDAQTRLMFGKYLEYQVTAKSVKTKPSPTE